MPVKKDICRNFQRGSCHYGERCKFLHVNSQQQPRPNSGGFGFGVPQNQSSNPFGQKQQNQSSNPFGFGVQSKPSNGFANKQQQFKPFENKWSRFSPISNAGAPFKQPENQPQASDHKCTDPDACKREIIGDFEKDKPLWKLTCYGHLRNGPCDIVGDVSYEELRAAAYDDARRGLTLQSIVERERNLLNSRLTEFENLLRNPYVAPPNSTHTHNSIPGVTPGRLLPPGQTTAPPAVSSFSQLGPSLGNRPSVPSANSLGQPIPFSNANQASNNFGIRPSVFSSNGFAQPNPVSNIGQSASAFLSNDFTPTSAGFNNSNAISFPSNPFPSSAMSTQITNSSVTQPIITTNSSNSSPNAVGMETAKIHPVNETLERTSISVDPSIWSKESWVAGEIPEEAPPAEYIR